MAGILMEREPGAALETQHSQGWVCSRRQPGQRDVEAQYELQMGESKRQRVLQHLNPHPTGSSQQKQETNPRPCNAARVI